MRRSALSAAIVILLSVAAAAQTVVVDGDLSDLDAVAQGRQSDPFNEICFLAKSGFDLRRVLVFYDESLDILYLGLDPMDVPDGELPGAVGRTGPGVPGDADGDEDPDTATEGSCPILEEQPDIGPDELYLVKIDTDGNGSFNDPQDVRVVYRDDTLRFERGDMTPLPGATGQIVLGTAGAPVDPQIPNQNPDTEDIEIAVFDWSALDPVPQCFVVATFSGSLVDGFPEDELIAPIPVAIGDPSVSVTKEVRNVTTGGPFGDAAGVEIGDEVEFRITIENTGTVLLDPAAVDDILPPELAYVPGSATGADLIQTSIVPGGLRIVFRQLAGSRSLSPGDVRAVSFRALVLDTIDAPVVNRGRGGGLPAEGCGGDRVLDEDDATVSLAALLCTKGVSLDGVTFADSAEAAPGQTVRFRVTVDNTSGEALEEARLEDTLPEGYEDIVALSPGCTVEGRTVTCEIGTLPAGGGATVEYAARIAADAQGTLVNTASATAIQDGTILLETSCSATVAIATPGIECVKEVSLDGVVWAAEVEALTGAEVFFRVVATNAGSTSLYRVSLVDPLPIGFGPVEVVSGSSCTATGRDLVCPDLGALDPGESAAVVYKASVTAQNPPIETLPNLATCVGLPGSEANPGDPVQTDCEAQVRILTPCLACTKEVSLDGVHYLPAAEAASGQHVWFRLTVTNCGTAPLENLVLSDPLPPALVNPVIAEAGCGIAGGVLRCEFPGLAPGSVLTVVFEADLDETAVETVTNIVSVTATPVVQGIPGDDLGTECSAQIHVGPLEIPTLSEWGLILLCSLFALTLILHYRFRHRGAFALD